MAPRTVTTVVSVVLWAVHAACQANLDFTDWSNVAPELMGGSLPYNAAPATTGAAALQPGMSSGASSPPLTFQELPSRLAAYSAIGPPPGAEGLQRIVSQIRQQQQQQQQQQQPQEAFPLSPSQQTLVPPAANRSAVPPLLPNDPCARHCELNGGWRAPLCQECIFRGLVNGYLAGVRRHASTAKSPSTLQFANAACTAYLETVNRRMVVGNCLGVMTGNQKQAASFAVQHLLL